MYPISYVPTRVPKDRRYSVVCDPTGDESDAMFATRTPTEADLDEIVALMHAADLVYDPDAARYTPDELRREWDDLDVATDAWVVVDDAGVICGYATLTEKPTIGRLYADAYTHPAFDGRGVGTLMLNRMHARADEFNTVVDGTRLVLVNHVLCGGSAQTLIERHGYELVRVYQQMFRSLDGIESEPARVWPDGITITRCDGSDASIQRAYECVEDAFADQWGRARRPFDEWSSTMVYQDFDPSLWIIAEHDGEAVGVSLCRMRDGDGYVDMLGVLRPWRRRGLGEALLRNSFTEFRTRGAAGVGLGTDSTSLTGADRLYTRVGMRVTSRIGRYERELRAGRDLLAEQAIF